MCNKIKCPICSREFELPTEVELAIRFVSHLESIHKLKSSEYVKIVPDHLISIRRKYLTNKVNERNNSPEGIIKSNNKLLKKLGQDAYDHTLKCEICGLRSEGQLYAHIVKVHKLTVDEYTKKYNTKITSDSYNEVLKNNSIKFSGANNPMFGKGESKNSPFSVEFYTNKGFSIEEAKIKVHEFATNAHENVIDNTKVEYYINKFNVDLSTAEKMLKERQTTNSVDKIAERKNISIEEAVEVRKAITNKWTTTINNKSDEDFIKMNRDKTKHFSKASMAFFNEFISLVKKLDKSEIMYGPDKEFAILTGEYTDKGFKKIYLYDFKYKNKIIEFNGDTYHANPNKYNENDIPLYFEEGIRSQSTAKEIWEHDAIKNKVATDAGYDVLVVWEADVNKDIRKELNRCYEHLREVIGNS